MSKEMLITVVEGEESRIAIVEDGNLEELYLERASVERHVGNIYKGRINNVEPSIQAAFVDIGMPKNGFLHASDVLPSACPRRRKQGPPAAEVGPDVPDGEPRGKNRHGGGGRRMLIQEIFRPGDEVVVQITKEGIGTKGPSLTTALSIPGRYLVLMPGLGRLGVSRKIEDEATRRQLRDLLGSLNPPAEMGFIVRTAGVDRSKRDLQRDLQYLLRLWKVTQARVLSSKAPAEIFRESDLVMRTLRDVYTSDIASVWVDSEPVYKRVREFMKIALPRHLDDAKLYTDKVPLFHKYRVEEAIERIYSRTVPLPKGGSLVIDQTEALVAIDVNSGRFRHGRDAEESAHQLNLMAAKEIARQVRMRDLGGLIIMDFVDMARAENRRHVEKVLRDAFKGDRARQQMLHISKFGIVEMTRQRVQPSLERSTFTDCPYCKGTGIMKHPESLALETMRHLKMLVSRDPVALIEVTVHPQLADHIQNVKRATLAHMEADSHKRIRVTSDPEAPLDRVTYRCTDDRGAEVRMDLLLPPAPPPPVAKPAPESPKEEESPKESRPPKAKGRRRGGRRAKGESQRPEGKAAEGQTPAVEPVIQEMEPAAEIEPLDTEPPTADTPSPDTTEE
jgi:ribonuclease E